MAEAPPPPPPAAVTSSGSSSKSTGIVVGIAVGTALAVLGQFCFFLSPHAMLAGSLSRLGFLDLCCHGMTAVFCQVHILTAVYTPQSARFAFTMTTLAISMTMTAVTMITGPIHQRQNHCKRCFFGLHSSQQMCRLSKACDKQQSGGRFKVSSSACLMLQVCCMHCTTSTYAPGFSRGVLTGLLQRSAFVRCLSCPACNKPCCCPEHHNCMHALSDRQ